MTTPHEFVGGGPLDGTVLDVHDGADVIRHVKGGVVSHYRRLEMPSGDTVFAHSDNEEIAWETRLLMFVRDFLSRGDGKPFEKKAIQLDSSRRNVIASVAFGGGPPEEFRRELPSDEPADLLVTAREIAQEFADLINGWRDGEPTSPS